jgi:hypothetical protein
VGLRRVDQDEAHRLDSTIDIDPDRVAVRDLGEGN